MTISYHEVAMSSDSKEPTDLRKYRRQTERRLTIAVVFFLVLVGGGLIGLIYGPGAAFIGISCLLLGAGIIGLLFVILTLMERWAQSE
jgi:fatty acid desaturase